MPPLVYCDSPLTGLSVAIFANPGDGSMDPWAAPISTSSASAIYFDQLSVTDPTTSQVYNNFMVQWNATLTIDPSELAAGNNTFYFRFNQADGMIVTIDGHPVIWAASQPGDANLDGTTDFWDISQLQSFNWNGSTLPGANAWLLGDLNGDGQIDFFDMTQVLSSDYNTGTHVTHRMIDNAGTDPNSVTDIGVQLSAGTHSIQVDYFNFNDPNSFAQMLWSTPIHPQFHDISSITPVVTIAPPQSLTEGHALSGPVATFTPSAPNTQASDYAATITWTHAGAAVHSTPATIAAGTNGNFTVSTTTDGSAIPIPGDATLAVTVTQIASGLSNTASSTVNVAAVSLNGSLIPIHPIEGEVFQGAIATFTVDNPFATPANFATPTIDWGGGEDAPGSPAPQIVPTATPGMFRVVGSHVYRSSMPADLSVTITDAAGSGGSSLALPGSGGGSSTGITPSGINVMGLDTGRCTEGQTWGGDIATLSDTDTASTDGFTVVGVLWSDGVAGTGSVAAVPNSPGHYVVTASRTEPFHETGAFFAAATITHGTNTFAAIGTVKVAEANIQIFPLALEAHAPGPQEPITWTVPAGPVGSFTDPNPFGHLSEYKAIIHWGDGSTSDGTITQNGSAPNVSYTINAPSHSYSGAPYANCYWFEVKDDGVRAGVAGENVWFTGGGDNEHMCQFPVDALPPSPDFSNDPIGTPPGDGSEGGGGGGGGGGGDNGGGDNGGGGTTTTSGYITLTGASLEAVEGSRVYGGQDVGWFWDSNDSTPPLTAADYQATVTDANGNSLLCHVELMGGSTGGFMVILDQDTQSFDEEGFSHLTINVSQGSRSAGPAKAGIQIDDALLHAVPKSEIGAKWGVPWSGTVATFVDDDPNGEPSDYTVTVDWGDGTPQQTLGAGAIVANDGYFSVNASHTYTHDNPSVTSPGNMPFARVTVIDRGGSSVPICTPFYLHDEVLRASLTWDGRTQAETEEGDEAIAVGDSASLDASAGTKSGDSAADQLGALPAGTKLLLQVVRGWEHFKLFGVDPRTGTFGQLLGDGLASQEIQWTQTQAGTFSDQLVVDGTSATDDDFEVDLTAEPPTVSGAGAKGDTAGAAGVVAANVPRVNELSFTAVDPTGYEPLYRDGVIGADGQPTAAALNDPIQWQDANGNGKIDQGEIDYSVAYSAQCASGNVFPKITAKFLVTDVPGAAWQVRGHSPAPSVRHPEYIPPLVVSIPATPATFQGGKLVATVQSTQPLPSKVDKQQMLIDWEVSSDGVNWTPAGRTNNECYVTLGRLTTGTAAAPVTHPILETSVDIGCRPGQLLSITDAAAATKAIWDEFKHPDLGVNSAEGTTLHYYGSLTNTPPEGQPSFFTAAGLVANGEGRCQAWARLLVDVLNAQGISSRVYAVLPDGKPYGVTAIAFYIKPIAGQGNPTPVNHFPSHAVVKIGNGPEIFDPSYGRKSKDDQEWRDSCINMIETATLDIPHLAGEKDAKFEPSN
jgi:hypothetical protein